MAKKQKEAKAAKETKKKEGKKEEDKKNSDDEDGEKKDDELKQKPNAGNGGMTDKYVWHQTLKEVTAYVQLPTGTTAKQLDVKLGINDMHIKLKANPSEPLLLGKWCKKIHSDEALWSIERDGDKCTLQMTIEKHEG